MLFFVQGDPESGLQDVKSEDDRYKLLFNMVTHELDIPQVISVGLQSRFFMISNVKYATSQGSTGTQRDIVVEKTCRLCHTVPMDCV
jgi:hypothetical protein